VKTSNLTSWTSVYLRVWSRTFARSIFVQGNTGGGGPGENMTAWVGPSHSRGTFELISVTRRCFLFEHINTQIIIITIIIEPTGAKQIISKFKQMNYDVTVESSSRYSILTLIT
jgi:hypothetical protein